MNKILFTFLALASFSASAAPEQFKSISNLIEEYNDYPTYQMNGKDVPSFKVISGQPLHIQISPRTLPGYTSKSIQHDSEKAAVYAAYRTLFQTPAESVKVTVIPLLLDVSTSDFKYLTEYKFDFSITKKQASNHLRRSGNILNSDQLMTDNGDWSDQFEKCCYSEEGQPGLAKFTNTLISQR